MLEAAHWIELGTAEANGIATNHRLLALTFRLTRDQVKRLWRELEEGGPLVLVETLDQDTLRRILREADFA